MSDRLLDPVAGDFVAAPAGAFTSSDDIDNQIAFSYSIPVGSWEGDPTLGHRLDELANATDTQANRSRMADILKAAVQWLVVLGSLTKVDTLVLSLGGGVVEFEVDYYTPGATKAKKAGPFLVQLGAA